MPPEMREADAPAYWLGPDREISVAEEASAILGTD
jgi:hypothetical protein